MDKKDNIAICPECGEAVDKRGLHNHVNSDPCYARKNVKKLNKIGYVRVRERKYIEYLKRNNKELIREWTGLWRNRKCTWTDKHRGVQLYKQTWTKRKNKYEAEDEVLPYASVRPRTTIQSQTENYIIADDMLWKKVERDPYKRRQYVIWNHNTLYSIDGFKVADEVQQDYESALQDVQEEEAEDLMSAMVAVRL